MWAAYPFVLLSPVSFASADRRHRHRNHLVEPVLSPVSASADHPVGQPVIVAGEDAPTETDHQRLTALHTTNVQQLEILEGSPG